MEQLLEVMRAMLSGDNQKIEQASTVLKYALFNDQKIHQNSIFYQNFVGIAYF